jgi:hypothetical protein
MQTGRGAQVVGFENPARATLEADDNQIEDDDIANQDWETEASSQRRKY